MFFSSAGKVTVVHTFKTEEEAVTRANDSFVSFEPILHELH